MPPPAVLGSLAIGVTGLVGESNGAIGGEAGGRVPCFTIARTGTHYGGGEVQAMRTVPTRFVNRIWRGEFVDMDDLLQDNLEAERRRGRDDGEPSGRSSRPTWREVPDMLSWAQRLCTYVGVVAEKQAGRVRQSAYQATMLREARRCGGHGWRAYDAMFRQLAAAEPSTDWPRLNPSLYATTLLAQQEKGGNFVIYAWARTIQQRNVRCPLYSRGE